MNFRLNIFTILILIVSISCKTRNTEIVDKKSKIDSLNTILKSLKIEKDCLLVKESELYSEIISIKPESPAGFSINFNSSTYGIGHILFAKNNRFKIENGKFQSLLKSNRPDKFKIYFVDLYGNWKMKNDTIILHATLAADRKFIKCTHSGAKFNEIIDTIIKLNWTDIFMNSISRKDKFLNAEESRILYDDIKISQVFNEDSLPGKYAFLSIKKITEADILNIPQEELRIMRNEIFARYGYQFKDTSLNNYFNNQEWYTKRYSDCNITDLLNEVERYNIELIKRYENK